MGKIQTRPETFLRQRRKRIKRPVHLAFIRTLPCFCGEPNKTEAAHIRMAYPVVGKRETGKGEKPSDHWTVPLCGDCHRIQHSGSEKSFWGRGAGSTDPILVALALYAASGDYELGLEIMEQNRWIS
jgi:hypothetical protein